VLLDGGGVVDVVVVVVVLLDAGAVVVVVVVVLVVVAVAFLVVLVVDFVAVLVAAFVLVDDVAEPEGVIGVGTGLGVTGGMVVAVGIVWAAGEIEPGVVTTVAGIDVSEPRPVKPATTPWIVSRAAYPAPASRPSRTTTATAVLTHGRPRGSGAGESTQP
jgi:hypothetical protein